MTPVLGFVVAHRSWSVPGKPARVLSFVTAHLPAGSKVVSTGSGGNPPSQSVIYSWPAIHGVLDIRWLYVSVEPRSGGGTLLYAESESQWVITRMRDDLVPTGVREVRVTSGWAGKRPFLSRRVTSGVKVRALVKLFDSLGIEQAAPMTCPQALGRPGRSTMPPTVKVTFTAGRAGRPLAHASVSADANFSWPAYYAGSACYPITFTVRRHNGPILVGNVIRPIQRLLHVKLDTPG